MDFTDYLMDNDHIVFAALCHIYSRQIENAMAKQVTEARSYSCSSREAPKTQLRLHVPHQSLSEIEFLVTAGGKRFDLMGICEIGGIGHDRPVLALRDHEYHYRPEHSRLLRHREFNEHRDWPTEEAYNEAVKQFARQRASEGRALNKWWEHIQQSEIISRLQVV